MIMYVRRRTYLVGYDKMLGRCIRNVSFYWHERYAIGEGAILDIRMPAICCAGCS